MTFVSPLYQSVQFYLTSSRLITRNAVLALHLVRCLDNHWQLSKKIVPIYSNIWVLLSSYPCQHFWRLSRKRFFSKLDLYRRFHSLKVFSQAKSSLLLFDIFCYFSFCRFWKSMERIFSLATNSVGQTYNC